MANYEMMQLNSGAEVSVQPMGYDDWEQLEEYRIEQLAVATEYADAGKQQQCNLCVLRLNKELRRRKFEATVKSSKTTLSKLTAYDARELEARIDAMNFAAVVLENLPDAGNGPAIKTA